MPKTLLQSFFYIFFSSFYFLGVIEPTKGGAAFWYDLETNLVRDHNTRHGGCPVFKGSKWILNKWMYAYDNFAKFPCDLKPKTKFKEPDNSHYFN